MLVQVAAEGKTGGRRKEKGQQTGQAKERTGKRKDSIEDRQKTGQARGRTGRKQDRSHLSCSWTFHPNSSLKKIQRKETTLVQSLRFDLLKKLVSSIKYHCKLSLKRVFD